MSREYEEAQAALQGIQNLCERISGLIGNDAYIASRTKMLRDIQNRLDRLAERCDRDQEPEKVCPRCACAGNALNPLDPLTGYCRECLYIIAEAGQ